MTAVFYHQSHRNHLPVSTHSQQTDSDPTFSFPKPTHMSSIKKEKHPFMFQHLFAGHRRPVINKMVPCGYLGLTASSRSKEAHKKNVCLQEVYGMTSEACRGRPTRQANRLRRQEGGFMRSIVNHSNSLCHRRRRWAVWEWASVVFAGQIYCSYPPDCVIIQQAVHQITLGLVTASCIRFTALYIHLLSTVKNSEAVNNWIKWM